MNADKRQTQLQSWLEQTTHWEQYHIEIASADASFRRYFRIKHQDKTYIAMDAPPEKEDIQPFIDISTRLSRIKVHAPAIYHYSIEQGFMLIEDFGNRIYLPELNATTVDSYYTEAIDTLLIMQKADTKGLPHYNHTLLYDEMMLMPQWFLSTHLNITLSTADNNCMQHVFQHILNNVTQQPQCFVHRDFHSRNLMVTNDHSPGIIDYQDAVLGPITYDLISLVRDCYITWPDAMVYQWIDRFRANHEIASKTISQKTFRVMADMCSLQRHIKVLGIFCRLYHRDSKPAYLNDLMTVLNYVITIASRYKKTNDLSRLLTKLTIKDKVNNTIHRLGITS